jgi:hypothetical protein
MTKKRTAAARAQQSHPAYEVSNVVVKIEHPAYSITCTQIWVIAGVVRSAGY